MILEDKIPAQSPKPETTQLPQVSQSPQELSQQAQPEQTSQQPISLKRSRRRKYPEAKNREEIDDLRIKGEFDKIVLEADVIRIVNYFKERGKEGKLNKRYFGMFCIANFGLRVSECCLLKRYHLETCRAGHVTIPTLKQRDKKELRKLKRQRALERKLGLDKNSLKQPVEPVQAVPGSEAVPIMPVMPLIKVQKAIDMRISCSSNLCDTIDNYLFALSKLYPENKENWVFPSGKEGRNHLTRFAFEEAFTDAILDLGLNRKYSVHALRHYRGTLLYRITRDLILVMKEMRHADSATTQIYVHIVENEEKMKQLRELEGIV